MNYLNKIPVPSRIRFLTISVVVGVTAIALTLLVSDSIFRNSTAVKARILAQANEVTSIQHAAFESRNSARAFLSSHDPMFMDLFVLASHELDRRLGAFDSTILSDEAEIRYQAVLERWNEYERSMRALHDSWRKIGLDETLGLHGSMRVAAHSIEDILNSVARQDAIRDAAKVELLMIRRHEKDFLQRLEPKYIDRSNRSIAALRQLASENFDTATNTAISHHIDKYAADFTDFANLRIDVHARETQLSEEARKLVAEITALASTSLNQLADLDAEASSDVGRFFYTALVFVVLTAFGTAVIANVISRSISRPLAELSEAMNAFKEGNYAAHIPEFTGTHEFATMAGVLTRIKAEVAARAQAELALRQAKGQQNERVSKQSDSAL